VPVRTPIMEIYAKIGNVAFLERKKTAFLCSRKAPLELDFVIKEWVKGLLPDADCIMCGNLSSIERLTLSLLLKAKIPTILMLAEAMPTAFNGEISEALQGGRLLVATHCDASVHEACARSASDRNHLMMRMADKIVVGSRTRGGNLDRELAGSANVTCLMDEHLRRKHADRERGIPVFGILNADISASDTSWSRWIRLSDSKLTATFFSVANEHLVRIEQQPYGMEASSWPQKISLNRTEAAAFIAAVNHIANGETAQTVPSASGDVTAECRTVSGQNEYVFKQDKDLGSMGWRHQTIAIASTDMAAFRGLMGEVARQWKI